MKRILENIKKLSTCKRHAVSAAIYHPGQDCVSVGWNWSKNCTGEVGRCGCIHAEPMAMGIEGFRLWLPLPSLCIVCVSDIEQACRRGYSIMWTSLSPCSFCLDDVMMNNRYIEDGRHSEYSSLYMIRQIIYTEESRHGIMNRQGIQQCHSLCKCMETL